MKKEKRRTGLKDIWNAYMCKGAKFGNYDIPFCPTTTKEIPIDIITWEEAKTLFNLQMRSHNNNFHFNAFICFYIDDYKFDGRNGIWHKPDQLLKILKHFDGVITPDFSTYQDFPEAIKIYATYRMRLIGYWLGQQGISVINNVRWGTRESFKYSFEGIQKHSIVCIGTVGGSPRAIQDRDRFENGLNEMVNVLKPSIIIVYGSCNYECFKKLESQGIVVVSFSSRTAKAFKRRRNNE